MLSYASANRNGCTRPRKVLRHCCGLLILLTGAAGLSAAHASDPILLNADRYRVDTGRYSVFATFQGNLQRLLDACGKGLPRVVDEGTDPHGRIGPETRAGIQRALECEALRQVPKDSAAHFGMITEAVWHALMPSTALPTVRERAEAMVLSFEATDFGDRPEWNFCQDSKATPRSQYDPKAPGAVCYNESDPCSFLTWGPRGATAGQGREIQWVLWLAWKSAPSQVEQAFAGEFANVRRFFNLKGSPRNRCQHGEPLERFMCAVWMDPARRLAWDKALVELGHSSVVRKAYAQLYAHIEFDGGKLQAFSELWSKLDLPVSEVDYAFFLDRITHLGGPQSDDEDIDVENVRACLASESQALSKHGAARRCLARLQPHSTQATYRLARDVAYYLDAYPEGALSKKEIKAWAEYVPLSAVHNFALSDARMVQVEEAQPLQSEGADLPLPTIADLTSAERNACPRDILFPAARKRTR